MAIEDLTDDELADLGEALQLELRRRALDRHDPQAVADQAFIDNFVAGMPADPYTAGGFVVCCGAVKARPSGRHRCSFVAVNGEAWSWQVGYELDEVRHDGDNMTSVTLLLAIPGLTVSQVTSTCDGGRHERQHVDTWRIERDSLVPIPTPSRIPKDHAR